MLTRQIFNVDTDTGTWVDTGAPFTGGIVQMGWNAETGDTGADLDITLLPDANADTGAGWVVFSQADCLGPNNFMKVPQQPVHGPDGLDTGVDAYSSIIGNGERLRVKVTPGGAAVVGKLYIWSYTG